ncbi:alpha/beta hydrolase [Streptomyces sp. NPDC005648]|uniref:alpha/beta hydrolase n=1 Tax=Streptomyces sp. NPDC005648 TaxID=3157044 RepID=UPI0033A99786
MESTGGQLGRLSRLQESAQDADPTSSTAMVYWLGYDAPEVPVTEAGNLSVAGTGRAEDGAQTVCTPVSRPAATTSGPRPTATSGTTSESPRTSRRQASVRPHRPRRV